MATDEDTEYLKNRMKLQPEDLRDPRKAKERKLAEAKKAAEDKAKAAELTEKVGEKVWVKCVTELGPWANGLQMGFWEDHLVSAEEAILLDERRFAVILATPTE
jgi:hypothetical protein